MTPPSTETRAHLEACIRMCDDAADTGDASALLAALRQSVIVLKVFGAPLSMVRKSLKRDIEQARKGTVDGARVARVLAPRGGATPDARAAWERLKHAMEFAMLLLKSLASGDAAGEPAKLVASAFDTVYAATATKAQLQACRATFRMLPTREVLFKKIAGGDTRAMLRAWAVAMEPLHLTLLLGAMA